MAILTSDECRYVADFYDDDGVMIRDRSLSVSQMLSVARVLFIMEDKRWLRLINAVVLRVGECGPEKYDLLNRTSYKGGEFYKLSDEERLKVNEDKKEEK